MRESERETETAHEVTGYNSHGFGPVLTVISKAKPKYEDRGLTTPVFSLGSVPNLCRSTTPDANFGKVANLLSSFGYPFKLANWVYAIIKNESSSNILWTDLYIFVYTFLISSILFEKKNP